MHSVDHIALYLSGILKSGYVLVMDYFYIVVLLSLLKILEPPLMNSVRGSSWPGVNIPHQDKDLKTLRSVIHFFACPLKETHCTECVVG